MTSNRHYEIDLIKLNVTEVKAPSIDEILILVDMPNLINPFGSKLKNRKYVLNDRKRWFLDEIVTKFNFQENGYDSELYYFEVIFSFDTPVKFKFIDSERFLYSLSKNLSLGDWRKRRPRVGLYFQLDHLEEGSIRGRLFAGVVAAGAFVATYPDLKQGFNELLSDARFMSKQISNALRAAKLPEPRDKNDDHREPVLVDREQNRRRPAPGRS